MADFSRPKYVDYARYLEGYLGRGYTVKYISRDDPTTGRPDPTQSFFHVTHASPTGTIAANLRLRFGDASLFHTTYKGAIDQPRVEPAIQVLTTGGRYWETVGGKADVIYEETDAGESSARVSLTGPLESLAGTIKEGFETTREKRAMGNASSTVEGTIFSLLPKGSPEETGGTTPRGALGRSERDLPSTLRRDAQSIAVNMWTDPNLGLEELSQKEYLRGWLTKMIQTESPLNPLFAIMKGLGYAFDIKNANRLTPYSQGTVRKVNEGLAEVMPYLPTLSVKHSTITNVSRQPVELLGASGQPLEPRPLTYAGRGQPSFSGYRQTTSQHAGRVPEASLMLGTLFSTQYPIPGAGMYFPETTGLGRAEAGYKQTISSALTSNVYDMIRGKIRFTPNLQAGQVLPSALQYQYGKLTIPGAKPDEEKTIDLQKRMGSASFRVGEQALRVPKYYDPSTGQGAVFNETMLTHKKIREITPNEIASMEERYGIRVITDELVSGISYELGGTSMQGGKVAIGGLKSDIVPYLGAPAIGVASGRGQKQLPISLLTYEAKAMPEAFLNSLAAMSPWQQDQMLKDYAASYQKEKGGTDIAKGIESYRRYLTNQRSISPEYRFEPERLAATAGFTHMGNVELGPSEPLPIHELGKDIFSRLFLGGKKGDELANLSEQELMSIASSKQNISNLRKYHIGFVAPGIKGIDVQPITRQVSAADVDALRYAYIQASRAKDPNISSQIAEEQFYRVFGFDPGQTGKMRTQSFTPTGFYMPMAAQPSVEFVGGGRWGAEEIMLLNQIAPRVAGRMGLGLADTTSPGAYSKNLVRDPVAWAQGQVARVASMSAARGTAPIHDPTALTITSDIAQRMIADPDFLANLKRSDVNITRMEDLVSKYAEYFPGVKSPEKRVFQFEGAEGQYVVSPQAIRNLATMQDVVDEEDATREINRYLGAVYGALQATASGDPSGITRSMGTVTRHFQEVFGLPEGGKRDITKGILGGSLGRVVSHYAYWDQLQQHQIFASEELIKSQIRMELASQGLDTPDRPLTESEVEQGYRYLAGLPTSVGQLPSRAREEGIPTAIARYPFVAGEESMAYANLITPEHAKRMGIEVPADSASGLSTYHFRLGLVPSTIFQGDFDLDYLMASLGLKGHRGKRGGLSLGLATFDKEGRIDPDVERQILGLAQAQYPDAMARIFASPTQRAGFDPLMGTLHQDERQTTAGGLSGIAGMLGSQMQKAQLYAYEQLAEKVATYSAAKMQMGTTYDYTRALESAAVLRGWKDKDIYRGKVGRAGQYQPFLDLSTGVPQPLVNLFQTSFVREKGGELSMGWRTPGLSFGEARAWTGGYKIAPGEDAFRLLRGLAGSAIYGHKEGDNIELPSPDALAWAFSPEGSRAFPGELTQEQIDERDVAYQALENALVEQRPQIEIDRLREQYYTGLDLYSALQRPFQAEQKTAETEEDYLKRRQRGMQDALVEWARVNYGGDKSAQILESPHITAMLGKSIASKRRKTPGWELPAKFAATPLGKGIAAIQDPFSAMFGLERSRISPANQLLSLVKWIDNLQSGSKIGNWALGAVRGTMGFKMAREAAEFGNLYEQVAKSPVSLRASEYKGIAYPSEYPVDTTLGRERGINANLIKSAVYSIGNVLGTSGTDMKDLVGAIFPWVDPRPREHILRGQTTEMALGGIMGKEQNWYTVNRWVKDPETGYMVPLDEANEGLRRRSAFNVTVQDTDEQGKPFDFEFGATPDFIKLYRDEKTGDLRVRFVEQKTPAVTRFARKEDIEAGVLNVDNEPAKKGDLVYNTFENINKGIAEEAKWQSRGTTWTIGQMVEQINAGDTNVLQNLQETLATYGIREDLIPDVVEALRSGRYESQVFVTQEGSAPYQEIWSDNPDPQKINELLNEDPYKTLHVHGAGKKSDFREWEVDQAIRQAARIVRKERPRAIMEAQKRLEAAPAFWAIQKHLSEVGRGDPLLRRIAGRSLDIAGQVWYGMRSIARGASQALGGAGAGIPVEPRTAVSEAAQYGPYTQEIARLSGLDKEGLEEAINAERSYIKTAVTKGKPYSVTQKAGVPLNVTTGAIAEIAEQMGYRSDITFHQMPSHVVGRESWSDISFSPIGPEPVAPGGPPIPPTPPSIPPGERPWESDPEWQRLNKRRSELGDLMNRFRIEGQARGTNVPRVLDRLQKSMEGIDEQMSLRQKQVVGRVGGPAPEDYAQQMMGYGTAQRRYEEERQKYEQDYAEWSKRQTVSVVKESGQPTGGTQAQPAGTAATGGVSNLTGSGVGGGSTGSGSTSSTAPSPDPDRAGLVDPTATIQHFEGLYRQYRDVIGVEAHGFRQSLQGVIPGIQYQVQRGLATPVLRQAPLEIARSQFLQYRHVAGLAAQLHKAGQAAIRAGKTGKFDPNLVGSDWETWAAEVTETETETGRDILDFLGLIETGTKGTEGQRMYQRQIAAFDLADQLEQANAITGIRSAAGLPLTTPGGQPILGLAGLLGDAGQLPDQKALRAFFDANPQLQALGRQSMRITAGVSSAQRPEVFGRAPQVLELGDLMRQLKDVPGFEWIGKAEKSNIDIPTAIAAEQSERLSRLANDLADNFEKLRTGTDAYGKAIDKGVEIERRSELKRQTDIESKRLAMYEAAAPLEAAGVVRQVQRKVPAGQPKITDYELTGAPVPPELLEKQQQFVSRMEEMQTLEESKRAGFRLDEDQPYIQRLLRRTLGGFGLMYMRSLWNIGTGGLGYGQQERIGLDQMLGIQAAQVTGQGITPYNQMQILANRTALAGTAYNPLIGLQNLAAEHPFVRDLKTGLGAGVGAYAFLQQMGMWGGEGSPWADLANGRGITLGLPGGRGIKLTSGRVAGAIGLASLTLSAMSNAKDVEGLSYRYSKIGAEGPMRNLSTLISMDTVSHLVALATNPEYRQALSEQDWVRRTVGTGLGYNQITQGMTPQEKTQFLTRATKIAIEDSPQYSPETMAQVVSFIARNNLGDTKQLRETLAEQIQSGVGNEELASQMLATFGYNTAQQYSQPYLGQGIQTTLLGDITLAMGANPPDFQQRTRMISGLEFAQGVGPAAYYIPGIGTGGSTAVNWQAQMAQLEQWAEYEGTPAGALWQQQYQNWYRDLQYGVQNLQPNAPGTQDPVELKRQELEEQYKSKLGDVREAMTLLLKDYYGDMFAVPQSREAFVQGMLGGRTLEEQEATLRHLREATAIRAYGREALGIKPTREEFARQMAMSPEERDTESRRQQRIGALQEMLRQSGMPQSQIQARVQSLYSVTDMRQFETQAGQIESAIGTGQVYRAWGLDLGQREAVTQQFLQMQEQGQWTPWRESFQQRLGQMEPWAVTQAYAYGENIPGVGPVPGWMVTRDILGPQFGELEGMPLNQAPFTMSGASHPQFPMLQALIGSDIFQSGAGQAFAQGYKSNWSGNLALPGMMGMQSYIADLQYKAQMASIGNQMAQWQLGFAFNTGVGLDKYAGIVNPQTGSPFGFNTGQFGWNIPGVGQYTSTGGGFWGAQDASRYLGYAQQEWQTGFQREQLGMQQRQWQQNFALQQKQATMQRGWTQEDWLYQDTTRAMQWGWKQEDFAEQARFMTGRDRRLAERQMRRETIMHDLEGEQIDKQKERQKELWKLEDERFDLSRQHNKEQLDMQNQQIAMSEKFFEERKKLEEEQVALQRAYQIEQMNLQKQAIGAQAAVAKAAREAQEIQNAVNLLMIINSGLWDEFAKEAGDSSGITKQLMDKAWAALIQWLKDFGIEVENLTGEKIVPSTSKNLPDASGYQFDPDTGLLIEPDPTKPQMAAVGNYLSAGSVSYVNEQGDEVFRPYWSGEVIPLTKYDPWKTTVLQNSSATAQTASPRVVNIYIGNRHLGEYILDEVENDLRIP